METSKSNVRSLTFGVGALVAAAFVALGVWILFDGSGDADPEKSAAVSSGERASLVPVDIQTTRPDSEEIGPESDLPREAAQSVGREDEKRRIIIITVPEATPDVAPVPDSTVAEDPSTRALNIAIRALEDAHSSGGDPPSPGGAASQPENPPDP